MGDLGPAVDVWLDWLSDAGQRVWQVLPLGRSTAFGGNSPYSTLSAFALDPIYLSCERLAEAGWLDDDSRLASADPVDYELARSSKRPLLERAFRSWRSGGGRRRKAYRDFVAANAGWLPDYALFVALRNRFAHAAWFDWPDELRDREPRALARARREERERIGLELFQQFVADQQWRRVREAAAERGVEIFGDLPIYVAWDSADVWANRELFRLDAAGRPTVVSGVPPDYYAERGQRWGNPIYRWRRLARDGYGWWIDRIRRNLELYDLVRIDHFRAFESYWEIPAAREDAVEGRWRRGPGRRFFRAVHEALPRARLVAEDLGVITERVRTLRDRVGLPGMRVLQFAFGEGFPHGEHLPHAVTQRSVYYTGTHDNNTVVGWFAGELSSAERKRLSRYAGRRVTRSNAARELARLAHSSVADLVVLPLQDVLGLDETARLNTPGVTEGNWRWRVPADRLTDERARRLRRLTHTYGRLAPETASEAGAETTGDS